MRKPYKMREVKRVFLRRPRWAENEIETLTRKGFGVPARVIEAIEQAIELNCGHIKVDPLYTYSNETAVRIRALSYALAPETVRKARCYECCKGILPVKAESRAQLNPRG